MRKAKVKYIVQSSIAVGVWIALSVVVSSRISGASQLAVSAKIVMWSFLWGSIVFCVYVLIRYYKKLDDYELNSDG
jgi:uncharacterized membrane protein YdcZ (DUF606 family)